MLADAVRAEGYRLSKNRTALFWSLAFVPLASLALGVIGTMFMKGAQEKITGDGDLPPQLMELLSNAPVNIAEVMVKIAGEVANPPVLLFVLIGVAALYAGDYRWETWRLISARNSRANLLLGKVTVAGFIAFAAMVFMLATGLADAVVRAAVFGRPLGLSVSGEMIGDFLARGGLSWLRIMQFTMFGLLTAVTTRSLLATLFVPLVVGVAQALAPQLLLQAGVAPTDWLSMLLNPGEGVSNLQAVVSPSAGDPPLTGLLLLKSWVSAALWTLGPLALALLWFQRQDLSKE